MVERWLASGCVVLSECVGGGDEAIMMVVNGVEPSDCVGLGLEKLFL